MQVEDISDANDDENKTGKSQNQDGNEDSDVKNYKYVKGGDGCNLDEIAEEVESMMLQQGSVEKSEKRKKRLELILQLLQEEKDEQSIDKTEPADMAIDGGGSMPIRKMSATEENKPPDGSSLEKLKIDEQKSHKPAGGGSMPIHKMSVTEENKSPDGSSCKPAGGGSMPIHKMSATEENKPPDSNSLEKPKSDEQKSRKPTGVGGLLICKMSATEENKPNSSGGGGTESIPQNQHCVIN